MTVNQLDQAIPALVNLNAWARLPYDRKLGMPDATEAIYDMKRRAIVGAIELGLCKTHLVSVERKCKTCDGTGMFKRWSRYAYADDDYDLEDCRRCAATGKVILRFAETEILGARWHTPRPKSGFLSIPDAQWECCELTRWEPEQPGSEFDRQYVIELLNHSECAVFGERAILRWNYWYGNPYRYSLNLGDIETCFVCGSKAMEFTGRQAYKWDIYKPGLRWRQAVCWAGCDLYACRYPMQWPENLKRWHSRDREIPEWRPNVPMHELAHSSVVTQWLARRGIVIGEVPPNEYGFLRGSNTFVQVVAHQGRTTHYRVADSHHWLYDGLSDARILRDAIGSITGYPVKLLRAAA